MHKVNKRMTLKRVFFSWIRNLRKIMNRLLVFQIYVAHIQLFKSLRHLLLFNEVE